MNLISCDGCAVVLDKEKLTFPYFRDDDDSVIPGMAEWDTECQAWRSVAHCPVCDCNIRE